MKSRNHPASFKNPLGPAALASTLLLVGSQTASLAPACAVEAALSAVLPERRVSPGKQPLTIRQAFNEALMKNPRAAALRARLGITKAEYWRATELPNPSVWVYNGFKAEQTFQRGAIIPVEAPWEIIFRLLLARKQVKQTDLEIQRELWLLRAQTRRTYTELVVAQETFETLVELTELARRLLEVASKRFQAGDVPELDVLKARLATSQAEIDREQGARRVVQAKQQLSIILGRPVQEELEVPRLPPFKLRAEVQDLLPDFTKPIPSLPDFLSIAQKHRLELKVVQQQIVVAKAGIKTAIFGLLPPLEILATSSVTGNPPTGPRLRGFTMAFDQPVPLLNFNQGEIAKVRATIKQLGMELKAQENIISAEVSAAYQRLLAARDRIRVYQEHVLADSSEVARLARRSYEVGQSDITSTLLAQQQNVQVRSQYLNAILEYQLAFTDLERSIGRALQ